MYTSTGAADELDSRTSSTDAAGLGTAGEAGVAPPDVAEPDAAGGGKAEPARVGEPARFDESSVTTG